MSQKKPESPERRTTGADRRKAQRKFASELPDLSAKIVTGPAMELLDVSSSGLRFFTTTKLQPQSSIELRLATEDNLVKVRARVIRCRVSSIDATGVKYECAVAFEKDVPLWAEEIPPEQRGEGEQRVQPEPVPTQPPADVDSTPSGPSLPDPEVVRLTVYVPSSGPDLMEILAANQW